MSTLYDFYTSQGQKLPSIAERKALASQYGITNYTGTAEQNTTLLNQIKTPTVISSKSAQNAVVDANANLDKINATITDNQTNKTTDTTKTTTPTTINIGGSQQADPMKDAVASIETNAANEISAAEAIFTTSSQTLDKNLQSTLNNIKQIYTRRKDQMSELNSATLGAKRVSGIVSGRDRYAQDFQTDILSREEQDGIKRLSDIDLEERNLIQQAENARDEKSMQLLAQKSSQLQEIGKEKRQAIQDLLKNAMDQEKLAIDKSAEQRQLIKDNIDNQKKYSESMAASIIDQLTGDKKKDDQLIENTSRDYGVDPNFVNQAVSEYQLKQKQATPSEIRTYDELVARGQYRGTFFNYLKTKKQAEKIASGGGGDVLSSEDVKRYNLPSELIGKSDRNIVQDLLVSRAPDWFKKSQQKPGYNIPADLIQTRWNEFRSTDDMKVYTSTIDVVKSGAKEVNSSTDNRSLEDMIKDGDF